MARLLSEITDRPAHIPYDETFERALIHALAHPADRPPPSHSVKVIPEAPQTLPIPLDHPSRQFPSDIPGVYLTHPDGALWGGPGYASPFKREVLELEFKERGIETSEQKHRYVSEKRFRTIEKAQKVAAKLETDLKHNEEIMHQIVELKKQREVERRVEEMMRENKKRKEKRASQG
jgi:hypothetical protein